MAERVGFEPTEGCNPSTVFKTAAIDRSATSPKMGDRFLNFFNQWWSVYNKIKLDASYFSSVRARNLI